ncbi:MAG: hypothetical protein K2P35_14135 [Lachnospiraceae bacterium]|jgi:hypothetical protein|nr:hypothetical protein [Lachnospiraceae bacterium]
MRNERASSDTRHARTGKDGAFFNKDGVLIATVEQFTSNVSWNNAKYSVLGDAQEHETANTFAISLTMSQIVVEDDEFIVELMTSLQTQVMPSWTFQGSLLGRNGSEERVIYRECVPSGQVDIQNVAVGDVIKRNWNFFVNRAPSLQSLLSVDRD